MGNYEPIMPCAYGALDPKVNMEPDFFTGFQPERRKEIVAEEAKFYHNITQPYSMDEKLEKFYTSFRRPMMSPSRFIAPKTLPVRCLL